MRQNNKQTKKPSDTISKGCGWFAIITILKKNAHSQYQEEIVNSVFTFILVWVM